MKNVRLEQRLLAHYLDATTLTVPNRRRSRQPGIPASAALLAVAALVAALAWMPW
jgi:hypothetical protein